MYNVYPSLNTSQYLPLCQHITIFTPLSTHHNIYPFLNTYTIFTPLSTHHNIYPSLNTCTIFTPVSTQAQYLPLSQHKHNIYPSLNTCTIFTPLSTHAQYLPLSQHMHNPRNPSHNCCIFLNYYTHFLSFLPFFYRLLDFWSLSLTCLYRPFPVSFYPSPLCQHFLISSPLLSPFHTSSLLLPTTTYMPAHWNLQIAYFKFPYFLLVMSLFKITKSGY